MSHLQTELSISEVRVLWAVHTQTLSSQSVGVEKIPPTLRVVFNKNAFLNIVVKILKNLSLQGYVTSKENTDEWSCTEKGKKSILYLRGKEPRLFEKSKSPNLPMLP